MSAVATKPEDEGTPYFFSLTEKRRLDPSDRGARVARDPSYPDSIRSSPLGPVFPKLDAAGEARLMARLPSLLDGPVVKTLPEPGDPVDRAKSAVAEPLVPDDFFGPDPGAESAAPAPPPTAAAPPPAADSAEPAILPLPMTAQANEEPIVPSVSYVRPKRWPWVVAGVSAIAAAAAIVIVIASGKPASPAKAAATATAAATTAEPPRAHSPAVPPPPETTAAPKTTATATPAATPSAAPTSTVAASPKTETGTLITSAVPGGHRLFIDNKFVGVTGRPVTVKCGKHNVRVGGKGDAKDYDVPCGGEVTIH
jgi:hypothetical protein